MLRHTTEAHSSWTKNKSPVRGSNERPRIAMLPQHETAGVIALQCRLDSAHPRTAGRPSIQPASEPTSRVGNTPLLFSVQLGLDPLLGHARNMGPNSLLSQGLWLANRHRGIKAPALATSSDARPIRASLHSFMRSLILRVHPFSSSLSRAFKILAPISPLC